MKFYLDTSVFGGYWDDIFKKDTVALFEYAKDSNVELIYSEITARELVPAPQRVRRLAEEIEQLEGGIKLIKMNHEAETLAENYVREGALSEKCRNDARHIALATVHEVNVLVSWNFKHMVNFMRIEQYKAINSKLGYSKIDIRTPKEVLP